MTNETLMKAKALELQIDECKRAIEHITDLGPMRYLTFESMETKTVQISGHLKPSLLNALMPRILDEIKELQAIYEEALERL